MTVSWNSNSDVQNEAENNSDVQNEAENEDMDFEGETNIAPEDMKAGTKCRAKWHSGQTLYDGTIVSVDSVNKTCAIDYADGDKWAAVPWDYIKNSQSGMESMKC